MALDILAAVVLISMMGLGYHKGALSQLAWLVAGVVAFLGARPAGAVCAQQIYGTPSLQEPFLDVAMTLLGGAVVYALVAAVSLLFVRFLKQDKDKPSGTDRMGGAVLGLGKAAVLVYVAAAVVLSMGATLEKADPEDRLRLRSSEVLRVAADAQPTIDAFVSSRWSAPQITAPTVPEILPEVLPRVLPGVAPAAEPEVSSL
jgi:uncharacterized membrane protein required for colicin V production